MPQDIQSCIEHELIRKNVESLVAAVNAKANGQEASTENVVWLDSFSQKWQEFECKNMELLCHIDFFEKTFEAQERSAFASTTTEIEKLLESNKKLESVFTSRRAELDSFHSTGKELIEICRQTQDLERVKNLLDSSDAQWNHFLCSLKGQAKFLESKLNAFSGFDANLRDFGLWLNKAETTLQYFNDDITEEALRLAGWPEAAVVWKPFKKIQIETDDNETKLESLNSIGTEILIGLKTTEAKETVQAQLNDVNQRWNQLKNKCKVLQNLELKQNQEKQAKAFNLLLQKLIELDIWLKYLEDEFSALTFPSEADSSTFQTQVDRSQTLQRDVAAKSSQVESYFLLGKRSLAKASEQLDPGPEELHLLTETVTEHLTETESKWITMREKIQHHCSSVTKTAQRLLSIESQLVKMKQILSRLESLKSAWIPVDEISANDLQSAVDEARSFEVGLMPIKIGIGDCDSSIELLKNDSGISSLKYSEELEDVKESLQFLEASVEDRLNVLMITALKKIRPTNQQPSTVNDTSPWERSSADDKEALCHFNTSPPLTSGSTASIEMHSRIELCANRLAELEKRSETRVENEDEHELIGRLCDALCGSSSGTLPLQSPMQVAMSLDADQKSELDVILSNLEEENRALQSQYDLLKVEGRNLNSRLSSRSIDREETLSSVDGRRASDREMIAETQLLRSYKDRLENRMCILEDHNDRLTSQLYRLRQLLTGEGGGGEGQRDGSFPSSKRSMSAPGTPSLTSLRQRKTPTYSSSMRSHNKRSTRDRALFSSDQRLTNSSGSSTTGRPVEMSQDSLCKDSSFGAEDDGSLFDIANVGKELNRLIDGMTSSADPPTAKDSA